MLAAGVAAAYSQTPAVSAGGVINAASFVSPVAPGSLVAVFGTDLAAGLAQADSIPLAPLLGDVSVTFNGVPAPLLFVSGGQVNAQLPWDVLSGGAAGTANVVVKRGDQTSAAQSLQVGPFSPGIFAFQPSNIAVAVIYPDGAVAAPVGAVPGVTSRPAKIGDVLIIYCTGLGAVDPPVANGEAAGFVTLRKAITTPTVMIGGVAANVGFAGLSQQFVGVNQINATILPGTPTGNAVSLQLAMGGITSSAAVTIAVGQ